MGQPNKTNKKIWWVALAALIAVVVSVSAEGQTRLAGRRVVVLPRDNERIIHVLRQHEYREVTNSF